MEKMEHVALVTGASRGIGRAIALVLGERGVAVAVNFRENEPAAGETVASIRRIGGRAQAYQADVRDLAAVQAMVEQAAKDLGPPDILVNNAGVLRDNLVSFMSEEEWREVVDTSLTGAFHCIKVVSRGMARKRYGRIVNISSDAGLMGDAMRANYAAAKAGILGLTKAVARELAASGVTVNAVAPGIIDTDLLRDIPEAKMAKQREMVPLRRLGTAEEVAELVAFLASERAGYITGQVISVDGGLRM